MPGLRPLGDKTVCGESKPYEVDQADVLESARSGKGKMQQSGLFVTRNILSVLVSMPDCLFAVMLFWSCQWVEMDISQAFFRSTISCEMPVPAASGACPIGTLYQSGQCSPVLSGQPGWSGSAHCYDQAYVVKEGTALAGRVNTLGIVGTMIANLFVSTMLIDNLGRKPVMIMAFFGCSLLCAISACAAHLSSSQLVPIVASATFIVYMFNGFQSSAQAMAADLSSNDEVSRSLAMTGTNIARNAGTVVGFLVGFFVLKLELADYRGVWTSLSIIVLLFTVICIVIMRETLTKRQFSLGQCCMHRCLAKKGRSSFSDVGRAFRMVWRDPFIRVTLPLSNIIACIGLYGCLAMTGSWAISICKYDQASASMMGVVQPGMIVLGSLSSTFLIPAIGPYFSLWIGLVFTASGLAIAGLGAYDPIHAPLFWWGGHGVVAGLGQGLTMPCLSGVWSRRVSAADQGKLFGLAALAAGIGTSLGTFCFSNFLFSNDKDNTPMELARSWFVGAALHIVVLVVNILAYRTYILPERRLQTRLQRRSQVAEPC